MSRIYTYKRRFVQLGPLWVLYTCPIGESLSADLGRTLAVLQVHVDEYKSQCVIVSVRTMAHSICLGETLALFRTMDSLCRSVILTFFFSLIFFFLIIYIYFMKEFQ